MLLFLVHLLHSWSVWRNYAKTKVLRKRICSTVVLKPVLRLKLVICFAVYLNVLCQISCNSFLVLSVRPAVLHIWFEFDPYRHIKRFFLGSLWRCSQKSREMDCVHACECWRDRGGRRHQIVLPWLRVSYLVTFHSINMAGRESKPNLGLIRDIPNENYFMFL